MTEDNEQDDEESLYRVTVPVYSTQVQARAESPNIETFDEFDAIRYDTSDIHLNSALFFADEAKRIEEHFGNSQKSKNDDEKPRIDARIPIGNRHDIYVIKSVTSTISFLEALINEFYDRHLNISEDRNSDKFEKKIEKEKNVSDPRFYELIQNHESVESRDFEYKSVLDKYQYLLAFADKKIFDKGSEPFQSVSSVKAFRNNLVHAEAEWIELSEEENIDIGDRLEGKFDLNPIAPSNIPPPRKYLSFECAEWSIESAFNFALAFYERMGVSPPKHVAKRENNLWEVESILDVEEVEDENSMGESSQFKWNTEIKRKDKE